MDEWIEPELAALYYNSAEVVLNLTVLIGLRSIRTDAASKIPV